MPMRFIANTRLCVSFSASRYSAAPQGTLTRGTVRDRTASTSGAAYACPASERAVTAVRTSQRVRRSYHHDVGGRATERVNADKARALNLRDMRQVAVGPQVRQIFEVVAGDLRRARAREAASTGGVPEAHQGLGAAVQQRQQALDHRWLDLLPFPLHAGACGVGRGVQARRCYRTGPLRSSISSATLCLVGPALNAVNAVFDARSQVPRNGLGSDSSVAFSLELAEPETTTTQKKANESKKPFRRDMIRVPESFQLYQGGRNRSRER